MAMGQHPGGEFANRCYSLVPGGPSLVDHESASAALALGWAFQRFWGSSKMTHNFKSLDN